MPFLQGFDILSEVLGASWPFSEWPSLSGERLRSEALAMAKEECLIEAAYSYSIVELDRPAAKGDQVLSVGGFTLAAPQLIPESGQLTAVACAVVTIGNKFEQRISALFAEKRASQAVALDGVGNQLLLAVSRYAGDRIHADVIRQKLTMAGELHAGDPGLDIDAQGTVLHLAQAHTIGIGLNGHHVMTPLKSGSMVCGVGIDLPATIWSRCDLCSSRANGKCQLGAGADASVVKERNPR